MKTNDIQKHFKTDSTLIKFKNIINKKYEQSLEEGLDKAFTYMNMDYKTARKKYYELVLKAETELIPTREQIYNYYNTKSVFKFELVLEKAQILNCMKAISETLIYRQESYVCTPTITHVVRILQSDKPNSKIKYPTNDCKTMMQDKTIYTNPFCSIGKYGFLISAMEQYGYLLRFYKEYCIKQTDGYDTYLCEKKHKKYNCRLNDAMSSYSKLTNATTISTFNCKKRKNEQQGGKRKTKRKNKRKKRSTKKLR